MATAVPTSPRVSNMRPKAGDLLPQMAGGALYRAAAQAGMNLSSYLELQDPSYRYGPTESLDAFERLLREANIVTRSIDAWGIYADTFEKFDKDDNTRALIPELLSRVWRRTRTGMDQSTRQMLRNPGAEPPPGVTIDPSTRALYLAGDYAPGSIISPYINAANARMAVLAPPVPLSEITAVTTPIDGDTYRAFYLTDNTASERLVRVNEGMELPLSKLVGSEHTVRLQKYGRVVEITYEALRRMRIDLVAMHIARLALIAEIDKVATALDVLVNGDGNSVTAATNYNLTALDSGATPPVPSIKSWLSFKLKFFPLTCTTVLAQEAAILALQLLNTGSANIPLSFIQSGQMLGMLTPINPTLSDSVRYGVAPTAPSSVIVGFDHRFALEQIVEIGASISEIERFVTRQTQALTFSEVMGFDLLTPGTVKTFNLAA